MLYCAPRDDIPPPAPASDPQMRLPLLSVSIVSQFMSDVILRESAWSLVKVEVAVPVVIKLDIVVVAKYALPVTVRYVVVAFVSPSNVVRFGNVVVAESLESNLVLFQ